MSLFGRSKSHDNGNRRDPADREKLRGAKEYEARMHDRRAERLAAMGDRSGAEEERLVAAGLRASVAAARGRKSR